MSENIFEQEINDIGICVEPFQGKSRASTTVGGCINKENDERWVQAVQNRWGGFFPRDEDGHLKIYNAGVVVFTHDGIKKARNWVHFQEYIDYIRSCNLGRFYWVDQNYFHAMICSDKNISYTEMDKGWNSQIHYIRGPLQSYYGKINDERNDKTKFVHVQMSGINWDESSLQQVVNKSMKEWEFRY